MVSASFGFVVHNLIMVFPPKAFVRGLSPRRSLGKFVSILENCGEMQDLSNETRVPTKFCNRLQ